MKVPIFEHTIARPLERWGFTGAFWNFHMDTLINTWIAMVLLFIVVLIGRYALQRKTTPFTYALEQLVDFFSTLCVESFGRFENNYFIFVTTLFIFTLSCNFMGMFPFVKEPTEDLNTTLAIALASFVFIQKETIKKEGLKLYIKEYFQPIFLLFPINLIEKLAKIISMSFRLFGNILGGSIIMYLLVQAIAQYRVIFMVGSVITLLGYWLTSFIKGNGLQNSIRKFFGVAWMMLYFLAGIKMFFGIFESVIQAFVVAMLTITYLSVVVADNSDHQGAPPTNTEHEKGPVV